MAQRSPLILTLCFVFLLGACQQQGSSDRDSINSVPEASEASAEESSRQAFLDQLPEASSTDWNLILVNRQHPLTEEINFKGLDVGQGQRMEYLAGQAVLDWADQAQSDGYPMQLISGYRSFDQQAANYQRRIELEKSQGYSDRQAQLQTEHYIMPAGASEHHTGLAMDLISQDYASQGGSLDRAFADQPAYDYYIQTMADFGFILRYPEGQEDLTGVLFEPWHFRYVGKEHAHFIQEHKLTLEEYIDLLEEREKD